MTSPEFTAADCASLRPHRYGACASDFAAVVASPYTRIFALAISASSTSSPTVTMSITANGFIALMVTESARCAASSLPDDVTNFTSTSRPHVS